MILLIGSLVVVAALIGLGYWLGHCIDIPVSPWERGRRHGATQKLAAESNPEYLSGWQYGYEQWHPEARRENQLAKMASLP